MSLEDFSYVSQVVASVSVVASLIYLALQMRQTARNQQAQMHVTRLQYVRDDIKRIADPAFFPTYMAGMAGDQSLRAPEAWQFMMFAYGMMLSLEEQHNQFQEGMINTRRWEPSRVVMRRYLAYPGFRAAFQLYRPGLDATFVALAEKLIAEVKSAPVEPNRFESWQQFAATERNAMAGSN